MTPEEQLRARQTATRIDPSGVRSTVYGPAPGPVPAGVLLDGNDGMPARRSVIQQSSPPPKSPGMRAAVTASGPIDANTAARLRENSPISQRMRQVQGMPTGTGQTAGVRPAIDGVDSRMPRTGPAPGAPGAPPPRPPGGPGASAAPGAAPGGRPGIIQRSAGAVASGLGEAARTAGRVAGGVAGPIQLGSGVNQLRTAETAGEYAGGAVRTGAGLLSTMQAFAPQTAATLLPRAGLFGTAAAIGMTAADAVADPGLEWIRSNPRALAILNSMREAVGSKPLSPLGEQSPADQQLEGTPPAAPTATAVPPAATVVPPRIDPQSGNWADINAQVRANQPAMDDTAVGLIRQELQNPNLRPQDRAALERELARVQGQAAQAPGAQAAGAPATMPAPRASGPITAAAQRGQQGPSRPTYGQVAVAYGGDPNAIGGGGARPVYGTQLPPGYDPETAIEVIRGNQQSIAVPSPTGFGYTEYAKDPPMPQSESVQDIARWAVDMQSRGMGSATDLIMDYLANRERSLAAIESARVNAGAQTYAADMRGPATITAEEPVLDAQGNPVFGVTRKQPYVYNPQTGQWGAVGADSGGSTPVVTAAEFDRAVQEYSKLHKVPPDVAAKIIGQSYRRGQ